MDFKDIKKILDAFDKSKANILEFETEEFRIYLDKSQIIENAQSNSNSNIVNPQSQQTQIESAHIHQEVLPQVEEKDGYEFISSPMVGTFYQAPSPDSAPYVKVGDKVKKGQVLCIIEAMKIMNELEAEFDCEIIEVLVEDGQPVEFETPLFKVKRI